MMRTMSLFFLTLTLFGALISAQSPKNLVALHDPQSPSYDGQCLKCHKSVLTTPSLDPRIASFHQAMLPYTPGYSPRKGPQDTNCIFCHRNAVDFDQESGSSLRRNVNVEACIYCHGRSGPGPIYYR